MRWVVLLLVLTIPAVYAHPFTQETWPNAEQNAETGTTMVWVKYSEDVELAFSSLKVYDGAGNQIDNRDTEYYQGQSSLIVSTPPLNDGIYTVASKVLSSVDGHLVPDTFTFAVGSAALATSDTDDTATDLVYLPEAGSRFLGVLGQTILVGVIISPMLVWRTQAVSAIRERMDLVRKKHHDMLMSVSGIALVLVFASNILVIVIQAYRLESFSLDMFQSSFGLWWVVRMSVTIGALGLWFVMEKNHSRMARIVLLALALVILWTSSQTGHPAASGESVAVVLDFVHSVVAAVWIGGLVYACFVMIPALSAIKGEDRNLVTLLLIPRLSPVFIVCLGVVILTGPLLLWLLESDVGMITGSLYGQLIIAKVLIASAMVGMGGYNQVMFLRAGKKIQQKTLPVYDRLRRSLRVEVGLGVLLLGAVALLVNGTLPAGELQDAQDQDLPVLDIVGFTGNTRFDVEMDPYTTGFNTIYVRTSGLYGGPVQDETGINVKVSNPARNITPTEIQLASTRTVAGAHEYSGEVLFGFAGEWLLEIESQREREANESFVVTLPVKPSLDTMNVNITEYTLPEYAAPLHPVYDEKDSIWISDPTAPRLWKFNLESREFESFEFDGSVSVFLDVDTHGRVWFTDHIAKQIGNFDPGTGEFTLIKLPDPDPQESGAPISSIQVDQKGDVWMSLVTKNAILRYSSSDGSYDRFDMELGSLPFALTSGPDGMMWFAANENIGYIVPETGDLVVLQSDEPLASAEALLFDPSGVLWIAEHAGTSLSRFDPVLETFERVPLGVPDGLPFGMVLDGYNNIWVAQHVVDTVVVYDPNLDVHRRIPLPTSDSFVQFVTADGDGNVWLVGQRSNSLLEISMQGVSSSEAPPPRGSDTTILYTEFVSPLIAAGILAASLFFVNSVWTARKLEDIVLRHI